MHSFLTVKLSEYGWLFIFNGLLFQTYLQYGVDDRFAYIDEIVVLILLLAVLLELAARRRNGGGLLRSEKLSLLFLGLTVCCGLLGNALYAIQTAAWPIFIDVFACTKFFLALCALFYIFNNGTVRTSLWNIVVAEAKLLSIALFFGAAINLFFDVGLGNGDYRYGFESYSFIFVIPECVNVVAVGLAAILISESKKNFLFVVLLALSMVATLRSKGIAGAFLILLVAWIALRGRKLTAVHFLLAISGILILGWDQINVYYSGIGGETTARNQLNLVSVQLANSHFPVGTGFATYGSAITATEQYYSPIYYLFGFNQIYGLALGPQNYISDTFWPTILGQFGYMGLMFYSMALILIFYSIAKRSSCVSWYSSLACLCCSLYLLVSSTAGSSFFSPQAIYIAFCLGLVLRGRRFNRSLDDNSRQVCGGGIDVPESAVR